MSPKPDEKVLAIAADKVIARICEIVKRSVTVRCEDKGGVIAEFNFLLYRSHRIGPGDWEKAAIALLGLDWAGVLESDKRDGGTTNKLPVSETAANSTSGPSPRTGHVAIAKAAMHALAGERDRVDRMNDHEWAKTVSDLAGAVFDPSKPYPSTVGLHWTAYANEAAVILRAITPFMVSPIDRDAMEQAIAVCPGLGLNAP